MKNESVFLLQCNQLNDFLEIFEELLNDHPDLSNEELSRLLETEFEVCELEKKLKLVMNHNKTPNLSN